MLTAEDLTALETRLSTVAKATIEEATGLGQQPTHDQAMERAMRAIRGTDRPAPVPSFVDCKSPTTGSTFRAELQRGVVVNIHDYACPPGTETHMKDGGLVPDGMVITRSGDDWHYRVWLKDSFWIVDLKALVAPSPGKPLPFGWAVSEAASLEMARVQKENAEVRAVELAAENEALKARVSALSEATEPKGKRG